MAYVIGVDVGGTFTDAVLDDGSGKAVLTAEDAHSIGGWRDGQLVYDARPMAPVMRAVPRFGCFRISAIGTSTAMASGIRIRTLKMRRMKAARTVCVAVRFTYRRSGGSAIPCPS